jgi:hypothetical protein
MPAFTFPLDKQTFILEQSRDTDGKSRMRAKAGISH